MSILYENKLKLVLAACLLNKVSTSANSNLITILHNFSNHKEHAAYRVQYVQYIYRFHEHGTFLKVFRHLIPVRFDPDLFKQIRILERTTAVITI
jgi:hypothetical protein